MAENYVTTRTENGNISISDDVLSVIVTSAAASVEGVAGFSNVVGTDLAELLGLKIIPKGGVKVSMDGENAVIDLIVMVRYGYGVTAVAHKVQDAVAAAVEDMTGMKTMVNVHVSGISFEKSEIK